MTRDGNTGDVLEGRSDEHAIKLGGITTFEMDSFMEVIDAR